MLTEATKQRSPKGVVFDPHGYTRCARLPAAQPVYRDRIKTAALATEATEPEGRSA
jgi:hypothetical protein